MDTNNNDMNLFDFLILCWNGFKRFLWGILQWLMQTVRLGLQYFWVVLICAVLGGFAGWFFSRPTRIKYHGTATVYVTEGMKATAIEGIKLFLSSLDTTRFGRYDIASKSVMAVRKLEFYNVIDSKCDSIPDYIDYGNNVSPADTMSCIMPDRFCISFKMKGIGDFTPFVRAFTGYLHELQDIHNADQRLKALARQKLDYLNREVARLDSFASFDYFDQHNYYNVRDLGSSIFISEREQYVYTNDLLALRRHRDYVQQQVEQTSDIINFQTPFFVTTPRPLYFYIGGVLAGGILGLLVALLLKYRKRVFTYLKQK